MNENLSKEELDIMRFGIKESAGYKNLNAVLEYSKKTREMFNNLLKENESYRTQIKQFRMELETLKGELQTMRVQFYQNKATS